MANIKNLILVLLASLAGASETVVAGLYTDKNMIVGCSFPQDTIRQLPASKVSFNDKTKTVRVVDSFVENQAKIQLDANTFAELGLEEGVSMVTYDEVICPENKPRYKNVEGSNQHWAQFVIYDHPTEIKEVYAILSDGIHVPLERTKYNTFEYPKQNGVVVSPLKLRIVDIYNNDKIDEIRSTCTKTVFGGLTPFNVKNDNVQGDGYNIHAHVPTSNVKHLGKEVQYEGRYTPLDPETKLEDKAIQIEAFNPAVYETKLSGSQVHEPKSPVRLETYQSIPYDHPYDRSGHGKASGMKVKKIGYRKEIANEGTSFAGKKICVPAGSLN
ncbi:hypothetical protein L0F63_005359 [Massospora cicadina]|nr:hypothetical protein L0F63_005359 [Massospora cicadina]